MSSEYTFYVSIDQPHQLGELFADLMQCQPVTNDFPDTWSFTGESCNVDVMQNLGPSFDDQERLIGAVPTAVILTPRKHLDWAEETALLRDFLSGAISLWKGEDDATGAILANDERLLAAKLPGSDIEVDHSLFDPDEYGQTSAFETLPLPEGRSDLSGHWPLEEQ